MTKANQEKEKVIPQRKGKEKVERRKEKEETSQALPQILMQESRAMYARSMVT